MSIKTKNLPNCDDVDFVAPVVEVMVFLKNDVLLNRKVSKKARLKDIFISGKLDPNGNYLLDNKPVDVNKTVIELIPKGSDQLTEVKLIIEAIQMDLQEEDKEIYFEPILKTLHKLSEFLFFLPKNSTHLLKITPKIHSKITI